MSAAESCWKDTAILDYVNEVQTDTVAAALAGTAEASCRCVSIAAPFNRAAASRPGQVTIKDVAGLYIYDNTLEAVDPHRSRRSRPTWSTRRSTSAGRRRTPRSTRPLDERRPDAFPTTTTTSSRASTTTIDISKPVGTRISAVIVRRRAGRPTASSSSSR